MRLKLLTRPLYIGGAKVSFFKMQKNPLQTLILYNGDQISQVDRQEMIGKESCLHNCMKYRNKLLKDGIKMSQKDVYAERFP